MLATNVDGWYRWGGHRLANIDWDLGYSNTTSLVPHENYTASVHRSYTSDSPQNTNCPCSISHNNYLDISRFDLNMTSTYHARGCWTTRLNRKIPPSSPLPPPLVLTLFSDSGHIAWCNSIKSCGLPQDDHARSTNSMVQLDCAHRINQCSCVQKMIAPS